MSHWNYRVLRRDHGEAGSTHAIHEVYYDDNGDATSWSTEPQATQGEALVDLIADWLLHKWALGQPVLSIVQSDDGEYLEVA